MFHVLSKAILKKLHLVDNPAVIIILGAFSVYNMIIARAFFTTSIPLELQEAGLLMVATTNCCFSK